MANDRVSEVELLLRSTIGELLRAALGGDWQQFLSRSVKKALERESKQAKAARNDVPEDPWAAAGLVEIEKVAKHFLSDQTDFSHSDPDDRLSYLYELWSSPEECQVDITRLRRLRDDQAHPGVAPPVSSAVKEEAKASMKRLRLGCESIRRRLAKIEEEWWPYIERVDCPGIDGWSYRRSLVQPGPALLNEGDLIEFFVQAINPVGPDEDLEYAVVIQPDSGSFPEPEWRSEPALHDMADPPGREVRFRVLVRSPQVAHSADGSDDGVVFMARVKPLAND